MFDPSQKAANYEASDCYWRLTPIQSRNIPTYSVLLMSHFYWGMGQEIASVQLLDRLARGVNKSNIFSFFLKIFEHFPQSRFPWSSLEIKLPRILRNLEADGETILIIQSP